MADPEVTSVTANRYTIDRGEFVRLIIIHKGTERAAYDCKLVINRRDGSTEETLFAERIVSTHEESQVEVPVRLESEGNAKLCAFLTDCKFMFNLPGDSF